MGGKFSFCIALKTERKQIKTFPFRRRQIDTVDDILYNLYIHTLQYDDILYNLYIYTLEYTVFAQQHV